MSQTDPRLDQLKTWLVEQAGMGRFDIAPASSDASFRRYFRLSDGGPSRIVMDAPPEREDCRPFVAIARAFRGLGLNVPEILMADLENGFLLLSDLGHRQYLPELNDATADALYGDALDALLRLQAGDKPADLVLPPYGRSLLMNEMELFRQWFLQRHLGLPLDEASNAILDGVYERLVAAAGEQPQVWVHRDYHSRNLMITEADNPGILDFQDAVVGTMTYDLLSLLRDAYVEWPRERVVQWVEAYRQRAVDAGLTRAGGDEFLRWFDLTGAQRFLKVAGIFARLCHRDGKAGYLADIPRVLRYLREVTQRYEEVAPLTAILDEVVAPRLDGQGRAR